MDQRSDTTHAHCAITPRTPLLDAMEIWLARLEHAGLDRDIDLESLDEKERAMMEQQRHHSRETLKTYRVAIRLFGRWLIRRGRTDVGSLAFDDLVEYTWLLRKQNYDLSIRAERLHAEGAQLTRLSPRTVHGYTRPILGFLALLESFDAIPFRTLALRAELLQALPRVSEPLAPTPPDLRRLVSFYDQPHGQPDHTPRLRLIRLRNAALLHLLFSSGARISEVLSLDIGDIYRDGKVLRRVLVAGKGRRHEMIFLRARAENAIATYLKVCDDHRPEMPLFRSFDRRTAGARLSRSSAWRIVHTAAHTLADQIEIEGKYDEAALLRTTSPHTFRHFVGYHLLNEGVELAEVSQILRHRSVDVTRTFYARYRDVQLQEVHDQFSADPLPSK